MVKLYALLAAPAAALVAKTNPLPRAAPRAAPADVEMKYRVAVIGGGPSGACAAEICAQEPNIETYIIERKMDNAKPCGGAIPLCMVDEFDLPSEIIDRKVRKMKMISPSNVEVDIGSTLKDDEYIGMCRREVMDCYLRDRAVKLGAEPINALVTSIDCPAPGDDNGRYTIHYSRNDLGRKAPDETLDVDVIIGADGANSRVAKAIDAGEYNYAIAFQERIKIDDEKMAFYDELAEMYVGDDVSPDFYGWVFPKYDHVGVGTGTVVNRPGIKMYQDAIRERAGDKIAGGKVIKVEAHPIPEHYRPRRATSPSARARASTSRPSRAAWPARPSSRPWPAARSFRPRRSSRTFTLSPTTSSTSRPTPCWTSSRRSSTRTTRRARPSSTCAAASTSRT